MAAAVDEAFARQFDDVSDEQLAAWVQRLEAQQQPRNSNNDGNEEDDDEVQRIARFLDTLKQDNARRREELRRTEEFFTRLRSATAVLAQPIIPHGISDYQGWLSLYTRPLKTLVSMPPPLSRDPDGSTSTGSKRTDTLIQRLDKLSRLNIIEVDNIPADYQGPREPEEYERLLRQQQQQLEAGEDVKVSRSGMRVGRLGQLGHERRLIKVLPPSRERFPNAKHKKVLRAPSLEEQQRHFEGRHEHDREARWPNPVWTAPARSITTTSSLQEDTDSLMAQAAAAAAAAAAAKTTTKKGKKKVTFFKDVRLEPDTSYRPRFYQDDVFTLIDDDLENDGEDFVALQRPADRIDLDDADQQQHLRDGPESSLSDTAAATTKSEGQATASAASAAAETLGMLAPSAPKLLPEDELLVPNPSANSPFIVLVDIMRDHMREYNGIALAFGYMGQKLAAKGVNYRKRYGYKTLKEMVSTARAHVGFGWTNPGDTNNSYVWLWDPARPYRHPSCAQAQWDDFRASRDGWEPPGLKQGLVHLMRGGGVGLGQTAKGKGKSKYWDLVLQGEIEHPGVDRAAILRRRTRAATTGAGAAAAAASGAAGPSGAGRAGDDGGPRRYFDHMQWVNNERHAGGGRGTTRPSEPPSPISARALRQQTMPPPPRQRGLERDEDEDELGREYGRREVDWSAGGRAALEDRERDGERDGRGRSDRDRDRDRDRELDRDREDRERDWARRDRDRDRDRDRADRERERERDRDRERERKREVDRDQARHRSDERNRDRDGDVHAERQRRGRSAAGSLPPSSSDARDESGPAAAAAAATEWRGVDDLDELEASGASALLDSNFIRMQEEEGHAGRSGGREKKNKGKRKAAEREPWADGGGGGSAGSGAALAGLARLVELGQLGAGAGSGEPQSLLGTTSRAGTRQADARLDDDDDEDDLDGDADGELQAAGTQDRFPTLKREVSPDYRRSEAGSSVRSASVGIDYADGGENEDGYAFHEGEEGLDGSPIADWSGAAGFDTAVSDLRQDLERTAALVQPVQREPDTAAFSLIRGDDVVSVSSAFQRPLVIKTEQMDEDGFGGGNGRAGWQEVDDDRYATAPPTPLSAVLESRRGSVAQEEEEARVLAAKRRALFGAESSSDPPDAALAARRMQRDAIGSSLSWRGGRDSEGRSYDGRRDRDYEDDERRRDDAGRLEKGSSREADHGGDRDRDGERDRDEARASPSAARARHGTRPPRNPTC